MVKKNIKENLTDAIIAGNTPQIVLYLLSLAFEMRTSDVHIEPGEKIVRVRFRIDGELREIIEYPQNIHIAIVSRIKIMSGMKIDETRMPQDGRMNTMTDDRKQIELRVSCLPVIHGEKVVMRLQDKNRTIPSLEELGMKGNNYKSMMHTIKSPNGIILVTGPTGSGKTTTLYSCMSLLNDVAVNIMTIEDPVEYEMAGLSQSQVKPDIGYDFAFGLRTALRQDPNIIMVGEIRDMETIEIAIKAALTGHMVLSTIHTNSAVSTITRILDMGVKAYKITSALRTIQAQRLLRRICPECKESYKPEEAVAKEIRGQLEKLHPNEEFDRNLLNNMTLYRGKGCEKCENMGTKGRIAVYEVMTMSREIEKLVLEGAREVDIEEIAIKQGMTTLIQDGYMKVLQGLITMEESYKIAND